MLLQLATRRLWKFVYDADEARHHVMRDALRQEAHKLGLVECAACNRGDDGQDLILAMLARHRDGNRLANPGMGQDLALQFKGGNVLATPADHVLEPVDEEEAPIRHLAKG